MKRPGPLVRLLLRRLLLGLPLLLGVSLLSFALMSGFAPDASYGLSGRNATADEIAELQRSLGAQGPWWRRYGGFLREIATLDFGHSLASGERVSRLLAGGAGASALAILPGFALGHALALLGALCCARFAGSCLDRALSAAGVVGTSLSLVVVVIGAQALLSGGLDWFPLRGWDTSSPLAYLRHVAVPTAALGFAGAVYNLRFYRSLLVAEIGRPYAAQARAFGEGEWSLLWRQVLPNAAPVIGTRLLFSVPLLLVSGSLVVESYFGIPGLGRITFQAATGGDQPVVKAVVTLGALLFTLALTLADALQRAADPRLELR